MKRKQWDDNCREFAFLVLYSSKNAHNKKLNKKREDVYTTRASGSEKKEEEQKHLGVDREKAQYKYT